MFKLLLLMSAVISLNLYAQSSCSIRFTENKRAIKLGLATSAQLIIKRLEQKGYKYTPKQQATQFIITRADALCIGAMTEDGKLCQQTSVELNILDTHSKVLIELGNANRSFWQRLVSQYSNPKIDLENILDQIPACQ